MLWLAQPWIPVGAGQGHLCRAEHGTMLGNQGKFISRQGWLQGDNAQNTQSLRNGTVQEWEPDMFFPWFGNNVNAFSHTVGEALWHTCALGQLCYPPRSPTQLLRALFLSKNMD